MQQQRITVTVDLFADEKKLIAFADNIHIQQWRNPPSPKTQKPEVP